MLVEKKLLHRQDDVKLTTKWHDLTTLFEMIGLPFSLHCLLFALHPFEGHLFEVRGQVVAIILPLHCLV
jgi:hypothetical protein